MTTIERLRRWEYPRTKQLEAAPNLLEYQTCICWMEEVKARVLQAEERAWMREPDNLTKWVRNYRLYLEILKIAPAAESEEASGEATLRLVEETFDAVVARCIEETYTSVSLPHVRRGERSHSLEPLVGAEVLRLATRLGAQPASMVELEAVFKSSLFEPSRVPEAVGTPKDVCRAIANSRLNEVQHLMNDTVAKMQDVTADITTDFRQARVGV